MMCTPSPTSRVLRHSSGAQMGMCVLLLVYLNCMQCTLLTRLNAWPPEILLLRFVRDKFKFGAKDMRILPDCITLGRLHHLVEVYIHHVIVLVLCKKDIHFVISTALWFVDCISHITETCVMRNCESYPITVLKILLMSSSAVFANNRPQSQQFCLNVFLWMKQEIITWKSMPILQM